jgi:N-methylhydantoinase A
MNGWMIGVDTGGSFTDLVGVHESTRELRIAKVPSIPSDPSRAVMNSLEELFQTGIKPNEVNFFVHGTTVATNALLEGKGVKTGLLMTKGFRAVYECRGSTQPSLVELVDPNYQKPPLLVPQQLTEGITERLDYRGDVLTPLDEAEVRQAIRRLKEKGIQSLAVCFLFSFLNPAHERRVAEIIAEEAPEWRVSLSSNVLPVIREYKRLSTTVIDAYVGPLVGSYLLKLADRLKAGGVTTPQVFIMQSSGGLMRIATGARYPNQMMLSGPAAGVIAGNELTKSDTVRHIVTFDMGGTSTDISVSVEGRLGETTEGRVAGQDIATPMLKVRTLGAGGGTIGWIGKDGLLKVGPQSAGADPGPASYGRGGEQPTVTDANLVLGTLGANAALAGKLFLNPQKARQAIEAKIGVPLGLDVVQAAAGIIKIVNNNMAVELRLAFQEEGQDPRKFAMIAFGGAGPLHAGQVARMVGISCVLVPLHPGLNCAIGLLQTAVRHNYLQSALGMLSNYLASEISAVFERLKNQALAEAEEENFAPADVQCRFQLEMRYRHQGYQLQVECPFPLIEADKAKLKRAFDALHTQTYGQCAADEDAEIVSFRVQSEMTVPQIQFSRVAGREGDVTRALVGERQLYDIEQDAFLAAKIYDRSKLKPGDRIQGPAVIQQFDSTTILLTGQSLDMDPFGTLVIDTGVAR